VFDQVITNMRQGMRDSLMPPRYLLEKVAPEAEDVAARTGDSSPFYKPLEKFPPTGGAADQQRLRGAVRKVIGDEVIAAYRRFAAFVRTESAPHGRAEPGIWALPEGEARYRYQIRSLTTTDLSPEEIHRIGLKQVEETAAEMLAVARRFGFNDL